MGGARALALLWHSFQNTRVIYELHLFVPNNHLNEFINVVVFFIHFFISEAFNFNVHQREQTFSMTPQLVLSSQIKLWNFNENVGKMKRIECLNACQKDFCEFFFQLFSERLFFYAWLKVFLCTLSYQINTCSSSYKKLTWTKSEK